MRTSLVNRCLLIASTALLGAVAGCGQDADGANNEKKAEANCDDSSDVLSVEEDGWSVISASSDAIQVSYGAILENVSEEAVKNGQVGVNWLDDSDEPVELAGGGGESSQPRAISALAPGDTTAVSGYTNLAEEPASVELVVNETCRLPADSKLEQVRVDDAKLSVSEDTLSASLSLSSSFPEATNGAIVVIFRDEDGAITGGGPFPDDAMPDGQSNVLESIPSGESEQDSEFPVDNFLPEAADPDKSGAYILPV